MSRQNLFVLQEVYGDLVDKIKQIIGMTDFSYQFNNYNTLQTCWPPQKCDAAVQRVGHHRNVMRQSACLVLTQSRFITMLPTLFAHRSVMMVPT